MDKKAMEEKVEEAKKMAEDEVKKIKEEFSAVVEKAKKYVKSNPEKAALIATGIGATVGAFLAGLTSKKKTATSKKKRK